MTMKSTALFAGLVLGSLMAAQAVANPGLNATQAKPSLQLQATAVSKPLPAVCGKGFTPVGMKLVQHEGKAWYEYTCARQEDIVRTCNADTDVTDVKDNIVSLPSDGTSRNSRLQLSYKCFRYVPVK